MMNIFQGLRMRKRSVLSGLCFLSLLYAGVQFYIQDDYSPLQLLSSVENEASRLLRFISQPHVHCNDSLATGNSSKWLICVDAEIGIPFLQSDDQKLIVYSVGPKKDYSFEQIASVNLSTKLFVFCHDECPKDLMHVNPSKATFYKTVIVPNDPADFARNSFDSQTLNTVIKTLHHNIIHILKLDTFVEDVESSEVLRFLIDDSFIQSVQELHFVVKLDKLDEDFIYSWYRVLYALFTTAGFRLFHTSASDSLCLQDTIMESCTYYLSWIKKPPPHVFVMYPPAIDGSRENEEDRLLNYLHNTKSKDILFTRVLLKSVSFNRNPRAFDALSLDLSTTILKKSAQSCHIIILRSTAFSISDKRPIEGCNAVSFVYSVKTDGSVLINAVSELSRVSRKNQDTNLLEIVKLSEKTIMFIDLHESWEVLGLLSAMALPKHLDQVIVRGNIFPTNGRSIHSVLRNRYSELQRLQEFSLSLVKTDQMSSTDLKFSGTESNLYILNFVKNYVL
ncbi:hypothetical protein EGW08_019913 [Elysia chlorotica]|uniref:Uncharacterized protein n=1 Tax=Elysia chlorotica TaxID=188477 RepID=A0A433SSV1_ELYCH|nr:hypothetical protein EGW08_019913 [Elysia chlorotica]